MSRFTYVCLYCLLQLVLVASVLAGQIELYATTDSNSGYLRQHSDTTVVYSSTDGIWGLEYDSGTQTNYEYRTYLWFDTEDQVPGDSLITKVEFYYYHSSDLSDTGQPGSWGMDIYYGYIVDGDSLGLGTSDWSGGTFAHFENWGGGGPSSTWVDLGSVGVNQYNDAATGTTVAIRDKSRGAANKTWKAFVDNSQCKLRISYGVD